MHQDQQHHSIFELVNTPEDLRKVPESDLRALCAGLREYLVDAVSRTGGHLGAGLGTVELAVALHYTFNTPVDKIVWDVGHQAYPHKLLTGRKDLFPSIRQFGGISGFLKREESPYDVFGAGHASTSISAALGIAVARDFLKKNFKVVAVIGDGAMTGGMAYEAMNNCGVLKRDMIVVLNDNNMSISRNVWAVSDYFNEFVASETYNRFRTNIWQLAGKFEELGDRFRKIAARLENGLKAILTPGMLFEAFGFRYFGPINGHNVLHMVRLFKEVRQWHGPILVHVVTEKGKGYEPAEADEQRLHGVTPFDKVTGKSPKKPDAAPTYTKVFGEALTAIVRRNPRVVGVTAAMPSGTGLDILERAVPSNYFDVGIAEQHAVTFCAGMATEGYIPVAAIYSTFLQRAIDQVIHDVALQKLHVVFAIDRGGLVGSDGPTHHGAFDLSYLRMIPGMTVMCPKDEQELRDMVYTAVEKLQGPVAIRYPRGSGAGVPLRESFAEIPAGKGAIEREGSDVAILAVGIMVEQALKAAEILAEQGIQALVANMRFVKPLDEELTAAILARFTRILTLEDNTLLGGFGSAVLEFAARAGMADRAIALHGLPDHFVEQGTPDELYALLDLHPEGIAARVRELIRAESGVAVT